MVEFHFLDWFWITFYTVLTVALGGAGEGNMTGPIS